MLIARFRRGALREAPAHQGMARPLRPRRGRCGLALLMAMALGCGAPDDLHSLGPAAASRPETATSGHRFAAGLLPSLLGHAVVGGSPAQEGEYAATGVLLYTIASEHQDSLRTGAMVCTGTLIAPDVVIVAAHCHEPPLPLGYRFKVSYLFSLAADVSSFGPHAALAPLDAVPVRSIVAHPEYEGGAEPRQIGQANDLALVYLERPLSVAPMRIPSSAAATALLQRGAPVEIVGYGRHHDRSYISGADGQKWVGSSTLADVGRHELEVGQRASDAYKCFGDSGGPTFVTDAEGERWMVGITSRGAAPRASRAEIQGTSLICRRGAIDTRLDAYLPWIESEMVAACNEGRRPGCEAAPRSAGPAGLP